MNPIDLNSKIYLLYKLGRFNNLTGTCLSLVPCLCAYFLSVEISAISYYYLIIFIIGSFSTRASGCIINDIFDRKIDALVERTKERPIASGKISVKEAIKFLITLSLISLGLLLLLPKEIINIAIIGSIMICIYPLMKRYFILPQLFLGITFNLGAIIGGMAANDGLINIQTILFYSGCVFWTFGYDTIYGYQDKKYDEKLGLFSSAIMLDKKRDFWLRILYNLSVVLWMSSLIISGVSGTYAYLIFVICACTLYWQLHKTDFSNPDSCLKSFKINNFTGIILLIAIVLGKIK